MTRAAVPNGPKSLPWIGSLRSMLGDPLSWLRDLAGNYGDIAYTWIGPTQAYMLNSPDLIDEVLIGRYRECIKDQGTRELIPLVGMGLLTSEGETWKRQRKLASPALSPRRIANYAQTMVVCAERTFAVFRENEVRDVKHDLLRLTLEIVGKTLLGFDAGRDAERVERIVDVSMDYFHKQLWTIEGILPRWVPTPKRVAFHEAIADLDTLVAQIIARGRAQGEQADHLLARLANARDEDGGSMSDEQLRDEAVTLLLAGHETTALTLTYAVYLLSENPDKRARLCDELARELGGRPVSYAALPRLKYLDAVTRETLRLYPPAYLIGREIAEPFALGGYDLPKGAVALMSPYTIQRDARFYVEPHAFRPERWLEPRATPLPRFAYFPFGGGPRVCIGNHFAQMEIALVLATLMEQVELNVVPGYELQLTPVVTLRPAHGLPVLVRRRQQRPVFRHSPYSLRPDAGTDA